MIPNPEAAILPMVLALAISVPVSLSLGGRFTLFGFDMLTFFDEITNTVLMPVCALCVCVAAGYGIRRREFEDNIFDGQPLVGKIISFMARFVTPLLILVVAAFGVVSNIQKNAGYVSVIIGAVCLAVAAVAVYFLTLYGKNTGCNADELGYEGEVASADAE